MKIERIDERVELLKLIAKHNIVLNDFEEKDELYVIGASISYTLISACQNQKISEVKKLISFIEDIYRLNNESLKTLFEIDVFTNIYTELGVENVFSENLNENLKSVF